MQVLEPLRLACASENPRLVEPALGCLHKLVGSQPVAHLPHTWPGTFLSRLAGVKLIKNQVQPTLMVMFCRFRMPTCMRRAPPQARWTMAPSLHR